MRNPATPLSASARAAALLPLLGLFTACSTLQTGPGTTVADTPVGNSTVFEMAAKRFATTLESSANALDDDEAHGQRAFNAGRAMLDLHCERYLDAVGSANQAASNERKQVSLIGGFAAAVMGLTGSPAKHIAGVATTFSFAGSSMDSYTTTYLFSDAAKSVSKIVRESQTAYLSALEGALPPMNHANVIALLTAYEALCRPAQIRALIDEAIAKTTIVAEVKAPQPADQEVSAVLSTLSASFGRPISELEAINLYAWYQFPSARSSGAKTEGNDPIAAYKKAGIRDDELARRLAQAFLPTSLAGSSIPARWSSAVKQIVNAAAPVAPAAAADGTIRSATSGPGPRAPTTAPRGALPPAPPASSPTPPPVPESLAPAAPPPPADRPDSTRRFLLVPSVRTK